MLSCPWKFKLFLFFRIINEWTHSQPERCTQMYVTSETKMICCVLRWCFICVSWRQKPQINILWPLNCIFGPQICILWPQVNTLCSQNSISWPPVTCYHESNVKDGSEAIISPFTSQMSCLGLRTRARRADQTASQWVRNCFMATKC